MFVYRDEYYNPDTADKNIIEVIIAKQRNGNVGTVRLGCNLDTQTILDTKVLR
jgi:replicative DNA helicase